MTCRRSLESQRSAYLMGVAVAHARALGIARSKPYHRRQATEGVVDMKSVSTQVLVLAMTIAAMPAMSAEQTKLPQYSVPRSEVRTLPVNKAGRHYALYIHLPASYATEPNKR